MRNPALSFLLALASTFVAAAQLAITEVQPSQAALGTPAIHADWWELTNFGDTAVDLSGWTFNDSNGGLTNGAITLGPLSIAPGESIVFVQDIDAASFQAWWGPGLPASVQIVSYATNNIGLSSSGDGIRLWPPGAAVDSAPEVSVDFGPVGGSTATFVYDAVTGMLTARAEAGVAGAFAAADGGDAGSPAINAGPVALRITSQPSDLTVNPGDTASFSVQADGLPRPRFQWRFGDVDLPGSTGATLAVSNASASAAGLYSVRLSNGITNVTSAAARLQVAAAPAPPRFTQVFSNLTVFSGAGVTLAAVATGVPQPTYAWYFGDAPIPGETNASLALAGVTTNRSGRYSVVASNASGRATNAATLTVLGRPDLRITEVSSTRTVTDPGFIDRNGFGPEDWWELTSFSPIPIPLAGWRFDDNSASLAVAITLTDTNLVIRPGESIVLVERLTPAQFRVWWGTNELPAGLQIVTYTGSGIGLSSGGDAVNLWSPTATANADTIAAVTFPAGEPGVSFNYDPDTGVFGALSVLGVNGVYQAPGTLAGVVEIGSPGRIREAVVTPPAAPVLSVALQGGVVRIAFVAEAGRTYRLERRAELVGAWVPEGSPLSPPAGPAAFEVTPPAGVGAGFFRVVVQ